MANKVDISKLVEQTRNRQLQNQVTAQTAKVKAQGGKAKKGGPSILSRIFDVIQRPLYGVQEGLARASEHVGSDNPRKGKNPLTDILEGMGMGVAGVTKTHMGDTLLRGAEANPKGLLSDAIKENKGNIRTGFGLVGDIGLDPTTYGGVGIVRGIGEQAAKTAGLKLGAEAIGTADRVRKTLEAGEVAKQARLAKGPVSIADKAVEGGRRLQTAAEVARKAEVKGQNVVKSLQRVAKTEGEALAKAEELSLLAANPGKVNLKFAGKVVGGSEKVYKGAGNLGKVVKSTAAGNALSEAFRVAHKFPEKANQLKREAELRGLAHAEVQIKEMREVFKGVAKDDRTLISHTIEKGPEAVARMAAARPELAPLFEKAQTTFREMGTKEVERGVFRAPKGKAPEDFLLDNYVYHYYEGGSDKARKAFKNFRRSAVGPESPNFTKLRTVKTLEDAKNYGLKPVENIDDILAHRIGKHHAAVARSEYVQAITKEYGVDVGSKWASEMAREAKKAGSTAPAYRGVASNYVPKGTVFPEHIAKSIEVLEKMHSSDELYNSFLRVFDAAQNHWKFGATSLNPGHHIRNAMGDAWNGFLDGVVNPLHYKAAARAMTGSDDGFKIMVKGQAINRPKLMELFVESGSKPGFISTDLLEGKAGLARTLKKPFNTVAEKREEYFRMAHFIHALKEEAPKFKSLEEAASEAGKRVRKWKIDYGDLTDFEKNVMKRAIPFYTFMRKNIPLQVEALAMRPGRMNVVPKGQKAIETLLGTEGTSEDMAGVPKWMKQMSLVRLRGEGEGKNAIYWLPGLPYEDLGKYTEGGGRGIFKNLGSMLTPALKSPLEYGSGNNLYTGAPIKSGVEFAAGHVPLARNIYNVAKGKQPLVSPKSAKYLTGVGIEEVTPAMKAGELGSQKADLQKTIRSIRDKAKKKATGGK